MRLYNKIFYLLFILLLFCVSAQSQQVSFSGGVGYGSYTMKGLMEFQNTLNISSPVELEEAQSFPPYYNWFVGIDLLFYPNEFGLKINGHSSGARSTYMDYSGRVDIDMIVSEISIGPTYKYQLLKQNENHYLSLGGEMYIGFNDFQINEKIEVYDQSHEQELLATSLGISLMPNFHYRFRYKFAHCGVQLGYLLGIYNGPLKHKGNDILSGGDEVRVNWSGYRIKLEIGFCTPEKR